MKDFLTIKSEYLYPSTSERFGVMVFNHIPGDDWTYKFTSLEAVCLIDTFKELREPETIVINGQTYGHSKYRILRGEGVYDGPTRRYWVERLNDLAYEMNTQFNFQYYLNN
jgi:hypothetical protein